MRANDIAEGSVQQVRRGVVALGVPAVGLYRGTDPALTGLHGDGKLANLGGPGRMPSAEDALAALKALT